MMLARLIIAVSSIVLLLAAKDMKSVMCGITTSLAVAKPYRSSIDFSVGESLATAFMGVKQMSHCLSGEYVAIHSLMNAFVSSRLAKDFSERGSCGVCASLF